ncbi:MAG: iron-containing alcohol dehydrogenase [Anaerolineae bacterium]|nr:iron-containing alcohol dehydrogenase [Anaerolineae bacterium]
MRFEFATAARILFGPGTLQEIGPLAAGMGSHALVVIGSSRDRAAPLLDFLAGAGVVTTSLVITAEPTLSDAQQGTNLARESGCDVVIGFGGGSAIDAAKAIAALLTNGGEPLDYLEVVGRGQPIRQPSAPCIAIPTTAGTGAEVTRNAVLTVPDQRVKVSLRSPLMLPRAALVDPELTYTMPPAITAATGMDALTQCIEPYICNQPNPLTDALCREGIQRAARSLRRAYAQGEDTAAREDMAIASLFGGLALANAKLGAVHGFAGPLGGMFDAPHGAVCARLLPFVTEANIRALRSREPDSSILRRYDEVARLLTGDESAEAEAGIHWLHDLLADLQIPTLSAYGVGTADVPDLIDKSARASSMKGNPILLTEPEMEAILAQAI